MAGERRVWLLSIAAFVAVTASAGQSINASVGGLEWNQQFDQAGNLVAAADPARPETVHEHDSRGVVTATKLPGDAEHRYTFDASGAMKSFTDPDAEMTGVVTDLIGRPLSRTYPDGTVESIEYEGVRIRSTTDRQGRTQRYEYNAKGQLTAIVDGGGNKLDELRYDGAGRLERWTNKDSAIFYGEFDLHGNPGRTVQTRYRDGSAFAASPEVLDEYEQRHEWNGYGERMRFTMPGYPAMPSASGKWARALSLEYDALGNVTRIGKEAGSGITELMTAEFRSGGRPDRRTVRTTSGNALERRYDYDTTNGLLNAVEVFAGDALIAATRITAYDGHQKSALQHLGVADGGRGSVFTYDGRSRLVHALIGGDLSLVPATEVLTKSVRTGVARTPPTPRSLPPQSASEHPSKGHKLGTLDVGGETNSYAYDGSERSEDDRFVYRWDHKGRLVSVTEKPPVPGATIRRIVYVYNGNDRVVGRTAQMAAAITVGVPLDSLAWTIETRPAILSSDGLPAASTFVWDPIADQLLSIFKAGASKTPTIDSEGGLLRQILHGQLSYDDPIETISVGGTSPESLAPSPASLYPLYDEAGTGSLQAIFGEDARLLARSFAEDAYGEGESLLLGGAIDSVTVRAKTDASGALSAVEVEMTATEPIIAATLSSGARLAAVDATGTVVRTSTVPPTLLNTNTIQWILTAAEWNELASSLSSPASSLSVAVTTNLRFTGWADVAPMPAPDWAVSTQPVYTSVALPVEVREPLANLSAWLASLPPNTNEPRTLYETQSLPALGAPTTPGTNAARLQQRLTAAHFHAHPFTEPLTAHNYVRARWYEPGTGTFLTPDPMGYQDSSNLYAFCAGDPVNCKDPRGEAARTDSEGGIIILNEKTGKIRSFGPAYLNRHGADVRRWLVTEGGLSPADADALIIQVGQGAWVGNQAGLRAVAIGTEIAKPGVEAAGSYLTVMSGFTGVGAAAQITQSFIDNGTTKTNVAVAGLGLIGLGATDDLVRLGVTQTDNITALVPTRAARSSVAQQTSQTVPAADRTVRHHLFNKFRGTSAGSQKYRDFFKKHGIKVDQFTVEIPEEMHKKLIHAAGTNWTTRWKQWIDANPNATTKEVYQFAGRLMDEYGLSALPIIPYR